MRYKRVEPRLVDLDVEDSAPACRHSHGLNVVQCVVRVHIAERVRRVEDRSHDMEVGVQRRTRAALLHEDVALRDDAQELAPCAADRHAGDVVLDENPGDVAQIGLGADVTTALVMIFLTSIACPPFGVRSKSGNELRRMHRRPTDARCGQLRRRRGRPEPPSVCSGRRSRCAIRGASRRSSPDQPIAGVGGAGVAETGATLDSGSRSRPKTANARITSPMPVSRSAIPTTSPNTASRSAM